jgi:HNH endonuclease
MNHKLSQINPEKRTAICSIDGFVRIRSKGLTKTNKNIKRYCCAVHHNYKWNRKHSPYIVHKGEICSRCGFIPENKKQLDVHHKDHNHENNEVTNLQTLCANCHRLIH